MKRNSSSSPGFIYARNLCGLLLVVSGLSLAAFSFAFASGTSKKYSVISPRLVSSPTAVTATPAGATLDPSNLTVTYTDGPLASNPTGILGAPVYFRMDINSRGAVTGGDVNLIKQNALKQLPPLQ